MELYHVLNRGVDKRKIFLDTGDRARFVHDLYEFNDERPAKNTERRQMSDFVNRSSKRLVDIHGWCLRDNHYHLLLSETTDGGISTFMRKLGVGYANYFNTAYERTGALFEGRAKKVPITREAHFLYILHYLHLNALDALPGAERWREGHIRNVKATLKYLEQYRWSSYLDYCGRKNFPSILTTSLFSDVFNNYEQELASYLRGFDLGEIAQLTLE